MNANFDIQKIEDVLAKAMKQGSVSQHVFKGHRPNINENPLSDFVVVSVATSIRDLSALGRCICRIELFAKNQSNGEKNGTKLSLMYNKVIVLFPIQNDTYIFDIYPNTIPLGNDGYGFSITAIQFNTYIKTI